MCLWSVALRRVFGLCLPFTNGARQSTVRTGQMTREPLDGKLRVDQRAHFHAKIGDEIMLTRVGWISRERASAQTACFFWLFGAPREWLPVLLGGVTRENTLKVLYRECFRTLCFPWALTCW